MNLSKIEVVAITGFISLIVLLFGSWLLKYHMDTYTIFSAIGICFIGILLIVWHNIWKTRGLLQTLQAKPKKTYISSYPKVIWLTGKEIMDKYGLSAIELYQYIKNGLNVYPKEFSVIMLGHEAQPLSEHDTSWEIDFDIEHSEEMYDYLKGYHFKVLEVEKYLKLGKNSAQQVTAPDPV